MLNSACRSVFIYLIAALFICGSAIAQDQKKPDATVEISKQSMAFIISGTRGSGTLLFQGKEHPFSLRALGIGGTGAANMDVTGEVYNLKDIKDFPGQFTSVRAGATVGTGQSGIHMQNNHGVEMWLTARTRGLALKSGADVFTVTMDE